LKKFFILLLFFLSGCASESIKVYSDEDLKPFDELLARSGSNAIKYDLRQEEDCLQRTNTRFLLRKERRKIKRRYFRRTGFDRKKEDTHHSH
jgi:hypothetical protein